ncbi:hypothetical protein BREVNS_0833 [Brevinematales bacterium NS]|nr:hypothetical protein BREVNS_0833 [Brevinematales bacterium NS]
MPLFPVFSVYRGLFVFSIQKIGLLITKRNIFILFLFFLFPFLRPSHIRAKVSKYSIRGNVVLLGFD